MCRSGRCAARVVAGIALAVFVGCQSICNGALEAFAELAALIMDQSGTVGAVPLFSSERKRTKRAKSAKHALSIYIFFAYIVFIW